MNQQPLEIFGEQSFGGYSLKLLHRSYSGPLVKITRHDDSTKILAYPNSLGHLSLSSTIELVEGRTQATTLGGFLCQAGYTADPAITDSSPTITAGVETLYDQALSINHLTNTDTTTQPLICDTGTMFQTEWGYAMQFEGSRFLESNVLEEEFTMHVRAQFPNTTGAKYLLRQDQDLYIKITDLYLDETEGFGGVNTEDTLVFLNEFYYGSYTTNNINLTQDTGYLITIEASVDSYPSSELNNPPTWRMENTGLVHTLLLYQERDKHVRRHATNQMLSEDIPLLQEKLKRYSPQSYYNYIAGAKAVFGVVSFQGVLLDNDVPVILRARRANNDEIDVRANNSGYISLDSKLGAGDSTSAKSLGEWLGAPGYSNPDSISHSDAYIAKLYSQGNPLVDIDLIPAISFQAPKLYNASTGLFSGGNAQGAVALDFYEPSDQISSKYLKLTTRFNADTVIVVYRNGTTSNTTQGLVASRATGIFSKLTLPDNTQHGLSVYDNTYFSPTDIGKNDTSPYDFHIVSLYPKNNPQRLVVDTQEMSIDFDYTGGLEGSPYEDNAKYEYVGAYSLGSYPHRGFISAIIFYDENKYAKRQQIHDYLNIMFGIQNIPVADPVNVPVIKSFTETKGSDTSSADFTVQSDTPTGIKNGELLVAVIMTTEEDDPLASTPTGWTLKTTNRGSAGVRCALAYRIADGTEANRTDFILNNSGTAFYAVYQFRIFGGTNYLTLDPIDVVGVASSQSTSFTSITASSVSGSTQTDGRLAIAVGGFYYEDSGEISDPVGTVGTNWYTYDTFTQGNGPGLGGVIATKEKVYIAGKPRDTEDVTFTPAVAQDEGVAFQFTIEMGEPAIFNKVWTFASSTESWTGYFATVSQIASYTPSSDTAKTGILVHTRNSASFTPQLRFNLASLSEYDNTETLYYRIVYSVPSSGQTTGLNRITWGNGGSYDDYSAVNSQTYDTWITVEGDLSYTGSDDILYINWDPPATSTVPHSVYIDSIRVSHVDFR